MADHGYSVDRAIVRALLVQLATLSRIAGPLTFVVVNPAQSIGWAAILAAIALTDLADGRLARLWEVESQLGAAFDTFSDKFFILAIFFWATRNDALPNLGFWLIVISYVTILVEGIVYVHRIGSVPTPNVAARTAALVSFVFAILLVAGAVGLSLWFWVVLLLGLNGWHVVSAIARIRANKPRSVS